MSERPGPGQPDSGRAPSDQEATEAVPGPRRAMVGSRWWLLPTVSFVAGLVLGGLLIAVVERGDTPEATAGPAPTSLPATTTSAPDQAPGSASDPCLEASDLAERLAALVREGVQTLGQLDAVRTQEALDQIERLEPQIEAKAGECRAAAARE